jgi:hypothetical protein
MGEDQVISGRFQTILPHGTPSFFMEPGILATCAKNMMSSPAEAICNLLPYKKVAVQENDTNPQSILIVWVTVRIKKNKAIQYNVIILYCFIFLSRRHPQLIIATTNKTLVFIWPYCRPTLGPVIPGAGRRL